MDEREIRRWLERRYPQLSLRRMAGGGWGIWQEDPRYDTYEMADGTRFAYVAVGHSLVFDIRRRLLGGWVTDEVVKRDPRYWANEGNHYHDAYLASKRAEAEKEQRDRRARESGEAMWNVAKRNHNLMNRVAKHMASGQLDRAVKEFSPENLYRAAALENPQELRRRDFWKSI